MATNKSPWGDWIPAIPRAATDGILSKFESLVKAALLPDDHKELRILVTGKTGEGKSTLVNGILGKKVAVEGANTQRCTTTVSEYHAEVEGVHVTVFDSPGLQDSTQNEDKYIQDMKRKCQRLSLILYCTKMTNMRLKDEDKNAILKLTAAFGQKFWEFTVLVLTFANQENVERRDDRDEDQGSEPDEDDEVGWQLLEKARFEGRVKKWKNGFHEFLINEVGVRREIVERILVVPAGDHRKTRKIKEPFRLPDRDDWFIALWKACSLRVREINLFFKINKSRIKVQTPQTRKQPKIHPHQIATVAKSSNDKQAIEDKVLAAEVLAEPDEVLTEADEQEIVQLSLINENIEDPPVQECTLQLTEETPAVDETYSLKLQENLQKMNKDEHMKEMEHKIQMQEEESRKTKEIIERQAEENRKEMERQAEENRKAKEKLERQAEENRKAMERQAEENRKAKEKLERQAEENRKEMERQAEEKAKKILERQAEENRKAKKKLERQAEENRKAMERQAEENRKAMERQAEEKAKKILERQAEKNRKEMERQAEENRKAKEKLERQAEENRKAMERQAEENRKAMERQAEENRKAKEKLERQAEENRKAMERQAEERAKEILERQAEENRKAKEILERQEEEKRQREARQAEENRKIMLMQMEETRKAREMMERQIEENKKAMEQQARQAEENKREIERQEQLTKQMAEELEQQRQILTQSITSKSQQSATVNDTPSVSSVNDDDDSDLDKKTITLTDSDLQEVVEESIFRRFGRKIVTVTKKCWRGITAPGRWIMSLF